MSLPYKSVEIPLTAKEQKSQSGKASGSGPDSLTVLVEIPSLTFNG